MWELVITFLSADSFMASVSTNIDLLAGIVDKYLAGMSNVRIVSILMMLLAFIVFLFLVIVIYVKSIIAFLKLDNAPAKSAKSSRKKLEEDDAEEENEDDISDNQDAFENELWRETQKNIELKRAEDFAKQQRLAQQAEQQLRQKKQQEVLRQQQEREKKQKEEAEKKKSAIINDSGIELDWQKGKGELLDKEPETFISEEVLSYQQKNKSLNELIALIIDMIARKVDLLKIAQTVSYRNQGQASEEDILQTITEINNFLALAVQGKFTHLQNAEKLPDTKTALLNLAQGDATYALALMEALMDAKIEMAAAMSNGAKKDQIFQETSYYACTFGTLSALTDVRLATGSFELAIELHPQNVVAWSRAADMYNKAGSFNQAAKTYQHVLSIADEEINIAQVANADKMLSQFYYEQGNNLQAAKLYNDSKVYYDSLGINRRLDRQELEIVDIIEQKQDMQQTIETLLSAKDLQLRYA